MNKSDKKILAFYVCLGISLISVFSYFDSLYERPDIDNFLPTDPIKRISIEYILNTVPHALMYDVITDVENYPNVLPKNRGGMDTWENLVTACQSCNRKKSNRTPEEAKMLLVRLPKKPNKIHYFQQFIREKQTAWRPYLFMESF